MTYYKLKYGISGMTKIITEIQYDELAYGDQYFYEKAVPICCGAAYERDSIRNIKEDEETEEDEDEWEYQYQEAFDAYDGSDFNLRHMVSQFYD